MFCIHCGKEIPDDAKFCKYCGQSCPDSHTAEPQTAESAVNIGGTPVNRSNITCPHCGERNCQPITKTTTQSQSGGYSCCAGLCGGILMGPLGLLLGLCGQKTSSSVTSQTKWVCMNCGKEFFSLEDARKKWNGSACSGAILLGTYIPCLVLVLIPLISCGIDLYTLGATIFSALLVGIPLLGPALLLYHKCKEGYDCYSLDDLFTEEEFSKWKQKAIETFVCAELILLVIVFILAA